MEMERLGTATFFISFDFVANLVDIIYNLMSYI